jgi:hypothetical protein
MGKNIICSCEGSAEEAIISLLIDSGKLCFNRDELVFEKITRLRTGKDIADNFLNLEYLKEVVILRILDRPKEKLKLPKAYQGRFSVYDVCTPREIEILIIIDKGKWNEYKKIERTCKPSEYCKMKLKMPDVKSGIFIANYFSDVDKLIQSIHKYTRLAPKYPGVYQLSDILQH